MVRQAVSMPFLPAKLIESTFKEDPRMPEIRTRVAPSPTGDPHIGTAFMLLFNYCFAKSQGGKAILRIEDTDRVRSTPESEMAIFESLKWVGLQWDEGPDIGGPHGPYRQSERKVIYQQYTDELITKGHAYRCFCTSKRLDDLRKEQEAGRQPIGYDGLCASLSQDEIQKRLDAGEPHTVRLRVPDAGDCVFHDMLRGDITTPWQTVDDQVLMKSDGFPTYHLAVVVDDHLMEISHIIRGEEWISSTPKHILLYQYFGWEMPEYCHLPLLRNPDKSKLSKRKNPTSINYYRRAGFLPEAILNYLGLMGYTLPDGREMFSLAEMVESFDIRRVSLGGPIFDIAKLTWLNGRYLREAVDARQLLQRLQDWAINEEHLQQIIPLAQPRIEKLSDFVPMTSFFFSDKVTYDPRLLLGSGLPGEQVAKLLKIAQWELEKIRKWEKDAIQSALAGIAEKEGLKLRDVVTPFFVAMSGSQSSTPLFDSMAILGSDMTRRRIAYALEALTGIGFDLKGKQMKELEKHYQQTYR